MRVFVDFCCGQTESTLVNNNFKKNGSESLLGKPYQGTELEALYSLRRYRRWIMTFFEPYVRGRVLEIGAGIGNMSELLQPDVGTLDLVEPSPNFFHPLTKKFMNMSSVTIIPKTFEKFVSSKPSEPYDCIVMVNVLEHIENDANALRECYGLLKPQGHLLIMVPALQFLFSDLDKLVGHYRRYEYSDLKAKALSANFELIKLCFFDSVGIIPWWLINTLGGATKFNNHLASFYDYFVVPVTRKLETLYPPPVGKNLISILRRS